MLLEHTGNQKMTSLFSEVLDFALTKAGKDSDFKSKTEQKSVIEANGVSARAHAQSLNMYHSKTHLNLPHGGNN